MRRIVTFWGSGQFDDAGVPHPMYRYEIVAGGPLGDVFVATITPLGEHVVKGLKARCVSSLDSAMDAVHRAEQLLGDAHPGLASRTD